MAATNSRNFRLRRVIYKSTALERAAPGLVAAASDEAVSAAHSIQQASAAAEEVRLNFKENRGIEFGSDIEGDDDDDDVRAQKYQRRLVMNRKSAAASRARRQAYTKALEHQLFKLERQYKVAEGILNEIKERNRELRISRMTLTIESSTPENGKHRIKQQPQVEDAVDSHSTFSDSDFDLSDLDEISPASQSMSFPKFNFDAPQSPTEELLADPLFHRNTDSLPPEIPDMLPKCFFDPSRKDAVFL